MVDVIAPRRGHELTQDGKPTRRFTEYLEDMTGATNTNTTNTSINTVNISNITSSETFELAPVLPNTTT